jgi:ribonuclease HII
MQYMVVGIDEVGRGCWAGPVVAGAVVLDQSMSGLKDSKVLTRLQRTCLSSEIYAKAAAVGLGWASAQEVDGLGLTEAVRLAMQRALAQITLAFDEVIIDGSYNFLSMEPRARAVIKADGSVPVVSAASIVAKVARDDWMCSQAAQDFPVYGFEKHVGYGTKLHQDMLRLHGVCSLHRLSYKPIRSLT